MNIALMGSDSATNPNSTQKCMVEMEDWVVCRIYQKKRKAKSDGVKARFPNSGKTRNIGVIRPTVMDVMMEDSTGLWPRSTFPIMFKWDH
ncbi:hypothetical protein F0562_004784 [Nyssa sinensis]|uniref:NAC domain-containing protein n=1 Tax=Nyssa sinensis TaxID=561372 RepID=A0A5J5AG93_9ASTE|nr:hypothetical protein F0562_004784 [Nyssa sinensis]